MKKSIARIISVLLVALMAIAMIPAVSAANVTFDTTTDRVITVVNDNANIDSNGLKFTAYKVSDITQENNALKYTNTANVTNTETITGATEVDAITLADGVQGVDLVNNGDNTFTLNAGKENGLYLIKCTEAPSNVKYVQTMFVQVPNMYNNATEWQYTATLTPKSDVYTVDPVKEIVLADGTRVKSGDFAEGDVVNFEVSVPVLGVEELGLTYFYVTDTMTKGLTYNEDAVIVGDNGDVLTDNFTVNKATDADNTVVTFTAKNDFKVANGDIFNYSRIVVKYTATINEYATMGTAAPNVNVAKLTVNDQDYEIEENNLYTYGIKINKTNDQGSPLAGAAFELKAADGNVIATGETDANGTLVFPRLKPGTYTLTETKAPAGYQLLANPISVELKKDMVDTVGVMSVNVTNTPITPPPTGGIGSTIFVVSGLAIIVMGAALFFISSRKRESK